MRRRVIAAIDDIFFASKVRAAAEVLDVDVRFVRTFEQLKASAAEETPYLIVVDLHSEKVDALALAKMVKADEKLRSLELLGFFSHVQTDLQRAAIKAGYDKVVARSVFSRDLAEILRSDRTVQ